MVQRPSGRDIDLKPWLRARPNTYVLYSANIVDVAEGTVVRGQTITLVNGKIESIRATANSDHTTSDASALSKGLVQLDCSELYICPGLIDSHVHLTAVPGFSGLGDSLANPESISLLRQPYVCSQMLQRGFTSIRDCGGAHAAIKDATEDGVFPAPRLFIAGHALTQSGGHGDFRSKHDHSACCGGHTAGIGRVCNGVPQCMQAVREEIRCGADFIKIMASGGVASPTDKIEHLQFTPDEIQAMTHCARNAGMYVTAHAYTVEAIRHAVDNGCKGIEHGNFLDKETAKLLVEKEVYLTPTLITYDQMASPKWAGFLPPASQAKNTEVLDAGLHALKIATENGVQVCFGTDLLGPLGAAQSQEFRLRAKVQQPIEVLRSATITPARMLGMADVLGQVKSGFAADLLFLSKNPLEDITVLDDPEKSVMAVMKEGRIYKSRQSTIKEDAEIPVRVNPVL